MTARGMFYGCLSVLCLALSFHLGASTVRGQSMGARMMTSELVLVDAQGRERGSFRCGRDGEPAISLYDEAKNRRATWFLAADGSAGFAVVGQSGAQATIAVDGKASLLTLQAPATGYTAQVGAADGSGTVVVKDQGGVIRCATGILRDRNGVDSPLIKLFDVKGQPIWEARR